MTDARAWSAWLSGDPVRLGSEDGTLEALRDRLSPRAPLPGLVSGPAGSAVAVSLGSPGEPPGWLWVERTPVAAPGDALEAVETLVWIHAPMAAAGDAIGLACRALGWLEDPERRARARAASTRQGLIDALGAEPPAPSATLVADDLFRVLGTSTTGLSQAEALRRLALAGENRLERVARRPVVLRLLEQFWSFFAILLWIGGALAILAGMPQLGVAVFVVILVNGVFSFFQEFRAERALEALERLLPPALTGWRDGRETRLTAAELVPGDVIRLAEGDPIPADGQLLASDGLRLDQGSLTGEPHAVFKRAPGVRTHTRAPDFERPERVFAGTRVMSGAGSLLVTATGMRTEIGRIARLTQTVGDDASPLQLEMVRVTRVVTWLALGLGALFFALGVGTGRIGPHAGLFFALGVIVANVPEGLLPTLTLALAMGVQRMARERSVIRRLSAVETLGAVQVILTDKTGTLTENRMTPSAGWTAAGEFEFPAAGGAGAPDPVAPASAADPAAAPLRRALLEGAVLASVATTSHGDPTERALVDAALSDGLDPQALREAAPVVAPHTFDSFRKRMTLVRARGAGGAPPVAWVKGAPRELLALCTRLLDAAGERALGDEDRRAFLTAHDRLANSGLRLLAVARRALDPADAHAPIDRVERDLTLLGFVAVWDPPRPDVSEAVATCRAAGIHVAIATGDEGLTARALAERIGLPATRIVRGEEVERAAPDTLRELALAPGVLFARVSPAHKLAVVQALRAGGLVVAVTGDGVNDAPALRAADIGVAMGRRGSEVAREASEMVITDDHFASIVSAVRLGRSIWANVGRFVTYVFASNVAELAPFLAFVLAGVPLPLTVMQVLAVDLGTDLLPALALGAEPPEPGLMNRPPRPRGERLLSGKRLLHAYGFLGVIEAALAMLAFFSAFWIEGWRPGAALPASGPVYLRATTMTFAGIVAAQVGNAFACRTERASVFRVGLFGNRLLLAGIAAEVALLLALVYVPPLAHAFGMAPPLAAQWRVLAVFPFAVLLADELRKWVLRRRERRARAASPGGA